MIRKRSTASNPSMVQVKVIVPPTVHARKQPWRQTAVDKNPSFQQQHQQQQQQTKQQQKQQPKREQQQPLTRIYDEYYDDYDHCEDLDTLDSLDDDSLGTYQSLPPMWHDQWFGGSLKWMDQTLHDWDVQVDRWVQRSECKCAAQSPSLMSQTPRFSLHPASLRADFNGLASKSFVDELFVFSTTKTVDDDKEHDSNDNNGDDEDSMVAQVPHFKNENDEEEEA